jgi:maltose alpha-D-glucosyltransferase/alpha-amylase
MGTYFESARLLGQRTGELHLALASNPENKDFAPEPFTPFYQRSLYQSLRNHLAQQFYLLRREINRIPESTRPLAEKVLELQDALMIRFRTVHHIPMEAMRIRCHGNFHLGHVLHTGKDFVVIDFEGQPGRSLSERRIKRPPFRDVAGLVRSFEFAAHGALLHQTEASNLRAEEIRALEPWTTFWSRWVTASFLGGYLATVRDSGLLPDSKPGLAALLDAFVLDRALTEVGHELVNRPAWLSVPLQSIINLVEPAKAQ